MADVCFSFSMIANEMERCFDVYKFKILIMHKVREMDSFNELFAEC